LQSVTWCLEPWSWSSPSGRRPSPARLLSSRPPPWRHRLCLQHFNFLSIGTAVDSIFTICFLIIRKRRRGFHDEKGVKNTSSCLAIPTHATLTLTFTLTPSPSPPHPHPLTLTPSPSPLHPHPLTLTGLTPSSWAFQ
jgi:hypothetical protein